MDILSAQQTAKQPTAQALPMATGSAATSAQGAGPGGDMFQSLLGALIETGEGPSAPLLTGVNPRLLQAGPAARPLRTGAVDGTAMPMAVADAPLRLRMTTATALTPAEGSALAIGGPSGDGRSGGILTSPDGQLLAMATSDGDALPTEATETEVRMPDGTVPMPVMETEGAKVDMAGVEPIMAEQAPAPSSAAVAPPSAQTVTPGPVIAGPANGIGSVTASAPAEGPSPDIGAPNGVQGAVAGTPGSSAPHQAPAAEATAARGRARPATPAQPAPPAMLAGASDGQTVPANPAEPPPRRPEVTGAATTPAPTPATVAGSAAATGRTSENTGSKGGTDSRVADAAVALSTTTDATVAAPIVPTDGTAAAASGVKPAHADAPGARLDPEAPATGAADRSGIVPAENGETLSDAEHRDWRGQAREARGSAQPETERPQATVQAQPLQTPVLPAAPTAAPPAGPNVVEAPGALSGGVPGIAAAAASQGRSGSNDANAGGSGRNPGDPPGSPVPDSGEPIPSQAGATGESQRAPAADFAQQLAVARHARNGVHHPAPQQIAVHVQRAALDGQDRLTLHLRPADLGRIDVQLDFSKDGVLRAQVLVENPATLDMLQRDARGLERALQEAGLKTDSNGLNFSLRDQGGEAQRENDRPKGRGANVRLAADPTIDAAALPQGAGPILGPGRVDVRI